MNSNLPKILNLKSVTNPNSIHGIYPYRGKISAVDATSLIGQLKPGVLLDPFCGSGTIIYEANKAGLDALGVDSNPLAIWIARGKIASSNKKRGYIEEATEIIKASMGHKVNTKLSPTLKKAFHAKTAKEVISVTPYFDKMSDYVKACLLGSIALTARGCNGYKWTSSTVGKDIYPKQYINFYDKFINKVKKHIYPSITENKTKIYLNDSRNLSKFIEANSIDYVFTSPPYFNALDYTAYYGKIIYELLGLDRTEIKKGLIQSVSEYETDMKRVLNEIIKVTKKNALIVFVVGDKKIGDNIINGGDYFSKLLRHKPNRIIERNYTGSSSQIFDKLNKTNRKEQIVIWDKSTWT